MSRESVLRGLNGARRSLPIVIPMLALAGCKALDPNYAYVTFESTPRLVRDSPEVRQLLEKAWRHNLVAGEMWVGRSEQEVVTTGPEKGTEGWACYRDVSAVGYWVM
jgi:hypothetical protein